MYFLARKDPLKFKVSEELTTNQTDEVKEKFLVFAAYDDNNDGHTKAEFMPTFGCKFIVLNDFGISW